MRMLTKSCCPIFISHFHFSIELLLSQLLEIYNKNPRAISDPPPQPTAPEGDAHRCLVNVIHGWSGRARGRGLPRWLCRRCPAGTADIGGCRPRGLGPAHGSPACPAPQECLACVPWDGDTSEPGAGTSGASPSPAPRQLEVSS